MALIPDSSYREQAEAETFPWVFAGVILLGVLAFVLLCWGRASHLHHIRESKVCFKSSTEAVVTFPSGQVSKYRRIGNAWVDGEGDYVSTLLDDKIKKVQRKDKAWGGCSCGGRDGN